jgi:hypothetical protein
MQAMSLDHIIRNAPASAIERLRADLDSDPYGAPARPAAVSAMAERLGMMRALVAASRRRERERADVIRIAGRQYARRIT